MRPPTVVQWLIVPLIAATPARAAEIERRMEVMGTALTLRVAAADRAAALAAGEAAARALESTAARLTTWQPDSALDAANADTTAVVLDAETAADLAAARACAAATGGAFDPTVAPLVALWDLRGRGHAASAAEIADTLPHVGFARFVFDGDVLRKTDTRLRFDEGGFGKGAGLDRALAAAMAAGASAVVLDLGGQIAITGAVRETVAVAEPDDRSRPVATIELTRGSLATSGNSERAKTIGGLRIGHILDPRTGRPAADFGSVTVWSESAARADCLSTALYVLGPEAGPRWAAAHPGIEALFLVRTPAGIAARATPRWQHAVQLTDRRFRWEDAR